MKKIIITAIIAIGMFLQITNAQKVATYAFSSADALFVPLTGATLTIDSSSTIFKYNEDLAKNIFYKSDATIATVKPNNAKFKGFDIGFDFTYHGKTYSQFVIGANGAIMLGNDSIFAANVWNPWFVLNTGLTNGFDVIGAMVEDGLHVGANTKWSYKAEANKLSVEFVNLGYTYNSTTKLVSDTLSFQIVLDGATNSIEYKFGNVPSIDKNLFLFAKGDTSAVNSAESDVTFIVPLNKNWKTPQAGSIFDNDILDFSEYDKGLEESVLPENYSYKLSVPVAGTAPTAIVDAIQLNSTTTNITGMIKNGDTRCDNIIVVLSMEPFTETLTNGTFYRFKDTIGDNKGVVVINNEYIAGDSIEFNLADGYGSLLNIEEGLLANTEYYFTAILYNTRFNNAPLYSTQKVSVSTATLTAAPAELNITSVSVDKLILNSVANSAGEQIIVLTTTLMGQDEVGNPLTSGLFGVPLATMNVGDTVISITEDYNGITKEFGGVVLYKGAAGVPIEFTGATSNTIYHFGAFSIGAGEKASTTFANADTMTSAVLPFYENFSTMPDHAAPYTWQSSSEPNDFSVSHDRGGGSGYVSCRMTGTDEGVSAYITTPIIKFSDDKDARYIFSYYMSTWSRMTGDIPHLPAKWTDKDSLCFQISENGVDFTTFYAINKDNADELENGKYGKRYIKIEGSQGKSGYIRILWKLYFKEQVTFKINDFIIEEVPACDFPRSVSVSDVLGDAAKISWVTDGNETQWEIRYKTETGEDVWSEYSEPELVSTNPYTLTKLPSVKNTIVEVRAVCGIGLVSEWVASTEFSTGAIIPYFQNFNNLLVDASGWSPVFTIPALWGSKSINSAFTDSTVVEPDGNKLGNVKFYKWQTVKQLDVDSVIENGAMGLDMSSATYGTSWVLGPMLNFNDPSLDYKLDFDIAYLANSGDDLDTTTTSAETFFAVVVSEADGKTFIPANKIREIKGADLVALGDSAHVTLDLSAYPGKRRIAFILKSVDYNDDPFLLQLNNVEIWAPCIPISNLVIENVTENTAVATFDENYLADSYLLKLESEGKETRIIESNLTSVELTGLERVTTYTVKLSYLCESEGVIDTADWTAATFTTAGIECNVVTNIQVTDITKESAKLSFEGSALRYKIAVKLSTATEYTYLTTTDKAHVITNLVYNSSYDVKIQSICGEAASDTSAYSDIETFSTDNLTCFPPTALTASRLGYIDAEITWTGTAANYQVSYRKNSETTYTNNVFTDTESATIVVEPETAYTLRVRSLCGGTDTSFYGEPIEFTTGATPACPAPTGLRVENITENSANLEWVKDAQHIDFIVRVRANIVTSWDTVARDITVTTAELSDLTKETVYLWSVCASCDNDRKSAWGTQNSFTTLGGTSNEDLKVNKFEVYTSNGQVHIINNNGINVKHIELISITGKLIEKHQINSTSNISFMPKLTDKIAILAIYTADGVEYIKLFIK